ncbi:hypothetical protein BSKO_12734 [Bryopsis sp. KO-2023]|nr:hypothetical protein BSKO_12734 [Bryopsis sp. KO-2023]
MYSFVSGERGAVPGSAKVPLPPDSSRRTPEGRRRMGISRQGASLSATCDDARADTLASCSDDFRVYQDYNVEAKRASSPIVLSKEGGSPVPELSGFPCSLPVSAPSPSSDSPLEPLGESLANCAAMEGLEEVKLEDIDITGAIQGDDPIDAIGDPMDCLPENVDLFNFLGEGEDTKLNFACLGLDGAFDGTLPELEQDKMTDLSPPESFAMEVDNNSMEMRVDPVEMPGQGAVCASEQPESSNAVVLGIPYYVACQWEQAQQAQVQQQQAAVMLWWQAYLCGVAGAGAAPGGVGFPPQQLGWSMPPQIASQHGAVPEFFPHIATAAGIAPINTAGKAGGPGGATTKRRRRQDTSGAAGPSGEIGSALNSKKGRRPKQEERVCKNCGTRSTPFWRKNKQDGLPLCNACGLYLAKNDAPRPKVLWKSGADETSVETPNTPQTPQQVPNQQQVMPVDPAPHLPITSQAATPMLAPSTPETATAPAHV